MRPLGEHHRCLDQLPGAGRASALRARAPAAPAVPVIIAATESATSVSAPALLSATALGGGPAGCGSRPGCADRPALAGGRPSATRTVAGLTLTAPAIAVSVCPSAASSRIRATTAAVSFVGPFGPHLATLLAGRLGFEPRTYGLISR